MKITVISDTHIPKKAKALPPRVITELIQSDLIIHAGDWQTLDVYHECLQFGEVKGVFGNVDSEELQALLPGKAHYRNRRFPYWSCTWAWETLDDGEAGDGSLCG